MNKNARSFGLHHPVDSAAAIDWKDLYNRIPDEPLIIQFAASFKENTHVLLERLEQSIQQNRMEQIEANAHALKGASANLGAIPLAKAAWQLEYAAHGRRNADFEDLMRAIHVEYSALMELLSQPRWIDLVKKSQS